MEKGEQGMKIFYKFMRIAQKVTDLCNDKKAIAIAVMLFFPDNKLMNLFVTLIT